MSRKTFGRIVVKFMVALSFCAVSAYALFLAYGYDYDLGQKNLKKTSIIDVVSYVNGVDLELNGVNLQNVDLPYQFKDILPGNYRLNILKEGFLPWHKNLVVLNDYVSKVSDVFLFPTDIERYRKNLINFVDDAKFYFNGESLVVAKQDQNYVTILKFRDDGTIQEDQLKLKFNNLVSVDLLSRGRFLFHFKDGTIQFFNLNNGKEFIVSALKDLEEVNFSNDEDLVFYLNKGALYRVGLNELSDSLKPVSIMPGVRLKTAVNHYTLAPNGVYYISNGMLFWMDDAGLQTKLIDRSLNRYVNLFYLGGYGKNFLLLRTKDNKYVYAIDNVTELRLIADKVKDDVLLNRLGQILYRDFENSIYFYDFRNSKKIMVKHFDHDFKLVSWFGDYHFIYADQNLNLTDIDYTNVNKLFTADQTTKWFIQNHALFHLKEGVLESFYWDFK